MENLFIQQAALELRASPFDARFFTPSRAIRGKCTAIVDLGGGGTCLISTMVSSTTTWNAARTSLSAFAPNFPCQRQYKGPQARQARLGGSICHAAQTVPTRDPLWITLRLALRHRRPSTTSRDRRRWHVFRIQQQHSDIRSLPPLRGYVQGGSPQFQRHCSPCAPAN